MHSNPISRVSLLFCVLLASCNCHEPKPIFLPAAFTGKVELIETGENDCNTGCKSDILKQAVKEPGQGGISSAVLLRLTEDVPVYRLWNGPHAKLNDYGGTNRIGSWWSADKPSGKVDDYRRNNAICKEWNELEWVTKCTIKKDTLVAVGSTQSANCKEGDSFSANPTLQIYVDNIASRFVSCPKVESANKAERDFEADPNELLLEKKPQTPPIVAPTPTPVEETLKPQTQKRNHKR